MVVCSLGLGDHQMWLVVTASRERFTTRDGASEWVFAPEIVAGKAVEIRMSDRTTNSGSMQEAIEPQLDGFIGKISQ